MAREMKDSGVEWIGQIPKDWNKLKMKQIGEYINGYAFKPEDWSNSGKPIIRIQNLTGFNNNFNYFEGIIDSKYLIKKNDILVSWAATLDAFIWTGEEGWLNQHIFKAKHNEKIIYFSFFYWLMKIAMENMNNDNKHGIVMQHVTTKVFGNFYVALPSLEEQERIANYLDKKIADIDLIIEKTKTTIEDYKKYKQSIITEAVTKGLNPNVEMKDSEIEWIGKIPKHWEVTKVKNIAYKVTDGAHVSPEIENGIYDFISTVNLKNNCIDFDNCLKTSEKSYAQLVLNNCNPKKNDVLISKDGTVGKTVVIDFDKEFIVASSLVIIRTNTDLMNPYFLNYNLKSKYIQDYLILLMVGAGLKRVSVEKNANLLILMPSLNEQQQIAEYLDKKVAEIDNLITKKESLIDEMEEYKKSLIYECVTGKKEL